MNITVFTPTFNRRDTLTRLYNSLVCQSYQNFEWVIVDDGSTDNTEELISSFIQDNKLIIKYYKQENGGKHRAINQGLELAEGELFFIVDSDDYLLENSLERVCFYYSPIKENNSFIGVAGFRCYPNGNIIGGKIFPQHITNSNLIERRERYGVIADMAHVLKTELFKKYLFPDIPNENFVAESLVWNRMAIDYKVRYFNEAIYVGEYLKGGLSHSSIKNRRKNPIYASLLYKELINNPLASKPLKFKSAINYWRFSLCKSKNIISSLKDVNNYKYALPSLPLGAILFVKDNFSKTVYINVK